MPLEELEIRQSVRTIGDGQPRRSTFPSQKDERAEFLADIEFFAYHGIGFVGRIFEGAIWLIPGIPGAAQAPANLRSAHLLPDGSPDDLPSAGSPSRKYVAGVSFGIK